jgi:2-polyprenyl-6-methoxyphenol hydroxylase-like FAD-dependent oxidoreductase
MLKKLLPSDLYARLSEAYVNPHLLDTEPFEKISLFNGQSGGVMKEMNSPGLLRIDRHRMRTLCKTGISVQYEKELCNITYGADGASVTAHFHDGTTVTGNILVGTDGARSVVREQLLGKERAMTSPSSTVLTLMKVNFHNTQKALQAQIGNPIFKLIFHPTGRMIMIARKNILVPTTVNTSNPVYSPRCAR